MVRLHYAHPLGCLHHVRRVTSKFRVISGFGPNPLRFSVLSAGFMHLTLPSIRQGGEHLVRGSFLFSGPMYTSQKQKKYDLINRLERACSSSSTSYHPAVRVSYVYRNSSATLHVVYNPYPFSRGCFTWPKLLQSPLVHIFDTDPFWSPKGFGLAGSG